MRTFASFDRAVFRAELIDTGYTDREIRRAVDTGVLTVLGTGVLIASELLDGTPEQRHREHALAHARRSPADRALTDASAAAVLGLPVWGLDTSRITMAVCGTKSRSRSTGTTRVIVDRRPSSTILCAGVTVVSPARVIVDLARRADRVAAIAVGDAALHAGLCTREDLDNELDLLTGMVGAAHARAIIDELDALSESVLESISRIFFVDAGLPKPELQVEFHTADGVYIVRVDFYWRAQRVVGLCDGITKYRTESDKGIDRLLTEKEQDNQLVELGIRPIHWLWKDLEQPALRGRLLTRVSSMLSAPNAA